MADSTGLVGNTGISISIRNEKEIDLNTILDTLGINTSIDWTFGTGENQVDLLWHDSRSTGATGETINVYDGGVEKNAFGVALTMEKIKFLYVKNTHENLTLNVFGVADGIQILANPTDILEIPPGGFFLWACPTEGGIVTIAEPNLKFASKTTGTITFDVVMLGLD